jgi:hypothetical protein
VTLKKPFQPLIKKRKIAVKNFISSVKEVITGVVKKNSNIFDEGEILWMLFKYLSNKPQIISRIL